ncbi:MAG: TIGR03118 family protein [Rickettsiales bacterium]|nr:TIGR03118 family protein [Rickettsiales bacterium]
MRKHLFSVCFLSLSLAGTAHAAEPSTAPEANRYHQANFVANKASYKPSLNVDKKFVNAWGIAIRPQGAGGHFWVTAKDISYEYVGDVAASPNEALRKLHQDDLKIVTLPVGGDDKFATGTVFNGSDRHFVITQEARGATPITAPAKFLFSSDGGIISAWTERKHEGGKTEFPPVAISVIDQSKEGAQFFGLALSHDYDRLYVADFGAAPALKVFDGTFKPENVNFEMPFDDNKNGKVDAGEYAPFNVQALKTPQGDNHIFVAYAKTQACPVAEVKAGACKKGEIFAGEEDIEKPGNGRLAEFTEDGELVKIWNDGGKLSAPWGVAYAPANFGVLSNTLLVSNFGDGTIAAFDANSRQFVDVMKNAKGKPVVIDKIWGILFGNGESLGDTNALYFAAGPKDETDGLFGSLRPVVP